MFAIFPMGLRFGRSIVALCLLPLATLRAQEAEAEFDRLFKEGFEPAVLLEDHGSDDGEISLLFSARRKGLGAADWPSIVDGVSILGTEVNLDECTTENSIVSLKDQKRLGVIASAEPGFQAYYPDLRNVELAALWGPSQEGWHYGVLNYSGRWGCQDIFFVNIDGEEARVTSMKALLDGASKEAITARSADPEAYEIGYELLEFENPENSATVTDPLSIRIRFLAQMPKDDEAEAIEGVLRIELSRDPKGVASATLKPAP
ncbi:MAG: hypothetical protein MUF31_03065 [Akkermansiaceae bacterium]|jgi:hypothetical protein|nr:hypothetical protein [Akkermansiaceae bacterium]